MKNLFLFVSVFLFSFLSAEEFGYLKKGESVEVVGNETINILLGKHSFWNMISITLPNGDSFKIEPGAVGVGGEDTYSKISADHTLLGPLVLKSDLEYLAYRINKNADNIYCLYNGDALRLEKDEAIVILGGESHLNRGLGCIFSFEDGLLYEKITAEKRKGKIVKTKKSQKYDFYISGGHLGLAVTANNGASMTNDSKTLVGPLLIKNELKYLVYKKL
jgi:hypothetical protein